MTNEQKEHWEHDILLRASGELPKPRVEALEEAVLSNTELAEFESFVELDLIEGARAPRDFVAEAITKAREEEKEVSMWQRSGLWAGIAAVLMLGGVIAIAIKPPNERGPENTEFGRIPISERGTAKISERGNELETKLVQARSGLRLSRFAHTETIN